MNKENTKEESQRSKSLRKDLMDILERYGFTGFTCAFEDDSVESLVVVVHHQNMSILGSTKFINNILEKHIEKYIEKTIKLK